MLQSLHFLLHAHDEGNEEEDDDEEEVTYISLYYDNHTLLLNTIFQLFPPYSVPYPVDSPSFN